MHGLKLCLFVTVDSTGATKILAACLLLEESVDAFSWAAECFIDAFRMAPVNTLTTPEFNFRTLKNPSSNN